MMNNLKKQPPTHFECTLLYKKDIIVKIILFKFALSEPTAEFSRSSVIHLF